jgi:glutaminase
MDELVEVGAYVENETIKSIAGYLKRLAIRMNRRELEIIGQTLEETYPRAFTAENIANAKIEVQSIIALMDLYNHVPQGPVA